MPNGDIINWTKLSAGGDVDLLSIHYAFLEVVRQLEVPNSIVEDLKLFDDAEVKVTEEGFREFLKVIISVPWDEEVLTVGQMEALNKIIEYLEIDYNQGAQPMQEGGIMLSELG